MRENLPVSTRHTVTALACSTTIAAKSEIDPKLKFADAEGADPGRKG